MASLGIVARVESDCPELDARLEDLLGHLTRTGEGPRAQEQVAEPHVVRVLRDGPGAHVVTGTRGARRLGTPGAVVDHVQWCLNQACIAQLHRRATGLHAAAAHRSGITVALAAPSGHGKSTLVSGLVSAGWDYLTDEAVELADDLTVRGFGKSITLDPGSQPLFPGWRPPWGGTASWYVSPDRAATSLVRHRVPLTHVVLVEWRPGKPSVLVRTPPSEAVMRLAASTFYFSQAGARHLRALASLVRRVPVWTASYPDLASGVRLVEAVASRGAPSPAASAASTSRDEEDDLTQERVEDFADGSSVVYLGTSRTLHRLNPSASAVWRGLRNRDPLLCERLAEEHAVALETVKDDVRRTAIDLRAKGLLDIDEPERALDRA